MSRVIAFAAGNSEIEHSGRSTISLANDVFACWKGICVWRQVRIANSLTPATAQSVLGNEPAQLTFDRPMTDGGMKALGMFVEVVLKLGMH